MKSSMAALDRWSLKASTAMPGPFVIHDEVIRMGITNILPLVLININAFNDWTLCDLCDISSAFRRRDCREDAIYQPYG